MTYELLYMKGEENQPELLREKFKKAWYEQDEHLSKLKEHVKGEDEIEYDGLTEQQITKRELCYENGITSQETTWMGNAMHEKIRYDERGHEIFYGNPEGCHSAVFYPDSDQREFDWSESGIKHFDKNGKEDTEEYLLGLKIEKVHKNLKRKGLMKEDAPDNISVTRLGKALASLALKKAQKSKGR